MCKIRPQTILSIILYIVLFDGILINSLHFPGIIIYMADALLVFLVAYSIIKKKALGTEERAIRNFVVIYMFVVTISYMFNYQTLFFFLWRIQKCFSLFCLFLVVYNIFYPKGFNYIFQEFKPCILLKYSYYVDSVFRFWIKSRLLRRNFWNTSRL